MVPTKQKPRCLLYQDDFFLEHRTGSHPECPQRLVAIKKALSQPIEGVEERSAAEAVKKSGLLSEEVQLLLNKVHESTYLHQLDQFAAHGGGQWDADTIVSPDSYEVAKLAAATAMLATDQVLTTETTRAFCAIRPPGHHAMAGSAMGFCLMNNIVTAARRAVEEHGLRRVLIVDWDVHHGNGTQDLIYEDEQIWFYSVHRHPFYPGTGHPEETGSGKGLGTICNVPLSVKTSRKEYLDTVSKTLGDFAEKCRPELVLISAGFDAHELDPIGSLGLKSEDFRSLTRLVCEIADSSAQGRTVSLLEGGYHLDALAESVKIHLEEFSSDSQFTN